MANLSVIEKIEAVCVSPKSRFMVALAQSLPQGVGILPAALVRGALSAIKASEKLQDCTEYSLFTSIAEVAQSGLSLDKHLGQASLVGFKNQCTVMYGYRGLCELARRSGEVTEIVGELRYSKDQWTLRLGSNRELIHVPADVPTDKRGAILGAYAMAEMLHGRPMFEYMTLDQIETIKNSVLKRNKDEFSPWTTNFDEMARKTPIRRLAKRLPQSPSLIPFVQAAIRDEYRQAGQFQTVDLAPAVEEALHKEHIEAEPVQAEARKSSVKEKSKEQQKAEGEKVIDKNDAMTVYTLMGDKGMDPPDLRKILDAIGHKGNLDRLPKSKLVELIAKMGEFSAKR